LLLLLLQQNQQQQHCLCLPLLLLLLLEKLCCVCGSQSELNSRQTCRLWHRRQPEVLRLQHLSCYQHRVRLRVSHPPAAGTAAAALQ
jgi:hypothetical protein